MNTKSKAAIAVFIISILLVSAAVVGSILIASREGGKEGGGEPGGNEPGFTQKDDNITGQIEDNEDLTGPSEDPYREDDDNESDPFIPDNTTEPADNKTGGQGNSTEPEDNTTEPDQGPSDNSTDDRPQNNETYPDENTTVPDENMTGPDDNSTEPHEGNGTEPEEEPHNDGPYLRHGSVEVEGLGSFSFEPWDIRTTRPDIFANGHISLFDILVYLDHRNDIDMDHHFDEGMNTFVIDSINGTTNWWYRAHYSGGWEESNAWRMDLYPYKDNTTIKVYQEDDWMVERIFDSFREQVNRKNRNNGSIVIPRVTIDAPSGTLRFDDVKVTAHDLRNDSFREGVITAMDVIMSLGDQGLITYELEWYETIGNADPVKNYWVESINGDEAYGTCGFVYEVGEDDMGGHNHIHIPSDQRVLTSPEYELFFWICL